MVEKRQYRRIPFAVSAEIKKMSGAAVIGKTLNIGFGGSFIEMPGEHGLQIGDECSVAIYLSGNESSVMDFQCNVVHCENNAIGVNFCR